MLAHHLTNDGVELRRCFKLENMAAAFEQMRLGPRRCGKKVPRVILVRRDPIQRARKYSDRAPEVRDDIRRVGGEHRPYGLAPTFGRHGVTQAFDAPPDQGRRVWSEQPVGDCCA
jgi:hypothetical protein